MSGIIGILHFDGRPADPTELERMAMPLGHRGKLLRLDHPAHDLAFAVLGTGVTGASPESPPASANLIVADLRLDNRRELADALAAAGRPLSSNAPDEAYVLAAYAHWGPGCVSHLLGDFAFAIWDAEARRLFCARDLMGMRPFYYHHTPRGFWFAPEVKALLALPDIPRRIEPLTAAAWLAEQNPVPERTFYEQIHQLPPGYAMLVQSNRIRDWDWWEFRPDKSIRCHRREEYADRFIRLFSSAVHCRLSGGSRSALMMSGGFDSASVAAVAGWLAERGELPCPPLSAFCWAFERMTACDERHVSDIIARRFGLPVTYVPADDDWPLADYPTVAPDVDDPLLGPYQGLNERTMSMARAAGNENLLTGLNGDLMTGCWIYDLPGLLGSPHRCQLPREIRAIAAREGVSARRITKDLLLLPMLQMIRMRPEARSLRQWFKSAVGMNHALNGVPDWVRPDFARASGLSDLMHEPLPRPDLRPPARRLRYSFLRQSKGAQVTTWEERNVARFGMTYIDVWSDRRLVEFVLSIPQFIHHFGGQYKWLVRESIKRIVPENAWRQMGTVYLGPMFQESMQRHARSVIENLLRRPRIVELGWVDGDRLRTAYESYCEGKSGNTGFYHALTLETWLRTHWD